MIGICIKYFHENYGGMLQAYATTKVLEKRGIEYEIIRYKKKRTFIEKIRSVPRIFNRILLNDKYEELLKKIGEKKHPEFARNNRIRMEAFDKFRNERFEKLSEIYVGYDALCMGGKKYSAVVTGSDQLWSPAGLPTNFYNLQFVADGIKKISYASSFGVGNIPWYQKTRTKSFLNRIEHISMRENRGREIVKELTGRDVPTVLDPVFMLNCAEWENEIPFKRELEEKYVFAYFLGNNPKYRRAVSSFAEENNLKVVTLRHLDQYIVEDESFGDWAPYDVAPDRFLNLLRGAKYIFTDSFHGACFSIINSKNFVVFNRYHDNSKHSKNSRIDTLCQNLNLSDRRYTGDISEVVKNEIDYINVHNKVKELIKEANEYLDIALEGVS